MVNCERKFPSYCWPWILIKLIHSRPGSGTSTHWSRNQPIDLLLLKLSLNGLQSVRLRPAFDCFKWQNGHVSMTQCGRFWGIELVWNVIRLLVPPPNRWQVFLALQPVWRGGGGGGGGGGDGVERRMTLRLWLASSDIWNINLSSGVACISVSCPMALTKSKNLPAGLRLFWK